MKRRSQKATRKLTRAHNSRLVLQTIYDQGPISRADIARKTQLTRTTVSDVVAAFVKRGLVEEVGRGPSAGGKPPILLNIANDSHHLIGIDLASQEFRGAVVSLRGEMQHRVSLPLKGRDGDAALDLVYQLIDELAVASNGPPLGIGIGTPGLMDPVNGIVRRAVNLDWQDLPLRTLLRKRYGLPTHVANDSQVAALAEHIFARHADAGNLVVVKIEHGIGAGIVLGGRLFHGDTFGAGEIGHVTVAENGEPCRCGNRGCLETIASARAIIQRAQTIMRTNPDSMLHQFVDSPEGITMSVVRQAVEAGDEALRDVVETAGRALGVAVANLIAVLSIRRVLLAGSITSLGEALLDVIRREMVARSLSVVAQQTEIGMSAMGQDIVLLGASAMVLTRELGLFAPVLGSI